MKTLPLSDTPAVSSRTREQLRYDLKTYLSSTEYDQIKDSPIEWLELLYPADHEVVQYGGNINHFTTLVNNILSLSPETQKALDEACWKNYDEAASPMKRLYISNMAKSNEYRSTDDLLYKINASVIFKGPATYLSHILFPVLQIRQNINETSELSIYEYNLITNPLRRFGINVHPDDDPILGMITYPEMN